MNENAFREFLDAVNEVINELNDSIRGMIAALFESVDFNAIIEDAKLLIEKQYRVKPRPPKVMNPTVRAPYIPIMPRARSNLHCPRKHRLCVHNGRRDKP